MCKNEDLVDDVNTYGGPYVGRTQSYHHQISRRFDAAELGRLWSCYHGFGRVDFRDRLPEESHPRQKPVSPTTAFCFLLSAASVHFLMSEKKTRALNITLKACAVAMLLPCVLILWTDLFTNMLDFEQLLFPYKLAAIGQFAPGSDVTDRSKLFCLSCNSPSFLRQAHWQSIDITIVARLHCSPGPS